MCTLMCTITDVQTSEVEFTEVVRKRRKRKSKKNKINDNEPISDKEQHISENESRARSNSRTSRNEKLDKLKELVPPKTFTVTIGEGEQAAQVKQKLWTGVLKKTDAPKVSETRVTAKGEIRITPADEVTINALKELC